MSVIVDTVKCHSDITKLNKKCMKLQIKLLYILYKNLPPVSHKKTKPKIELILPTHTLKTIKNTSMSHTGWHVPSLPPTHTLYFVLTPSYITVLL